MTPEKPGFNNDGETFLKVGNYTYTHLAATQNMKFSESLALCAAVDYAYNSGYLTTGSYSKDDLSARLSLLYKPNERLSAYLYGHGAQKAGKTENLVNEGLDSNYNPCEMCYFHSDSWDDTREGAYAPSFQTGTTKTERNHYFTDMIGGEIHCKFKNATLSYLPSYLYLDARPLYWLSAIQSTNTAHYNQFEQELRLASNQEGP